MPEKTIDDKNKPPEENPKEPEKDAGEELAGVDTSKFSAKEMIDYIDKLKDENAKRRINSKKLEKSLSDATAKLKEMETTLSETTSKLTAFDEEAKKKADKEKTEIQQLTDRIKDMEGKITSYQTEITESKKKISEQESQLSVKSRETMVERLILSAGIEFSSEFERRGFLSSLTATDSSGQFKMLDEEVVLEVNKFVKKTKEAPKVPGGGPKERQLEPTVMEQIKTLTAKRSLTKDDMKTLNELLELTGQAEQITKGPPPTE